MILSLPLYAGSQPTSIYLTTSANPSILGAPVTLTAVVSPSSATGSVTFYTGATILETEPLVYGRAVLISSQLPTGRQSLTAVYSGDAVYAASASAIFIQNVAALPASGFAPEVTYGTACGVTSTVVADFNRDGKPDIVFNDGCGFGPYEVGLMLGNGDGTFQPPTVIYPAGTTTLAEGDFNGDGIPDLLLGGTTSMVLLGNGDGTFQPPISVPATGVVSVLVADFNGDGKADLAVTDDYTIHTLLGNGDGTFQSAILAYDGGPGGPPPIYNFVSGNFSNDGKVDIALTGNQIGAIQEVVILLGNGDGTFQTQPVIELTHTPGSIIAGDFNSDGNSDLAFVSLTNSYPTYPGSVGVLLGNGDGTFQNPTYYPTVGNAGSQPPIATGDLNGDGNPDIVFVSGTTLSVLFGEGNGAFQSAVNTQTSLTGPPFTFVAADLNLDGRDDLVSAQTNVGVILNRPQAPCASVNTAPLALDANGGSISFTISVVNQPCAWSVATGYPLSAPNQSSGTESATVTATAAPNTSGADESTNIDVSISNQPVYVIPVTVKATAEVFADVPPSAYYFDAVNLLSAKGITSGCSAMPLDFCPAESITRAEMAIFIVRSIFGGDNFTPPATPIFNDVAPGDFGFAWIQELSALGITSGCGNGDYCPDDSVTRAEAAVFLIRARYGATALFDYSPVPYFTDVPPTAFGFPWIQRMAMDSITDGCAPKLYCPDDAITRGDMAIFIMRSAFNQLLPPGEPVITQISPAAIPNGQTTTVTVTGNNTTFSASTIVNPIAGVTIGPIAVTSPTTFTVALTPTGPALSPESIWVTTGTQEAVLPNGLTVQ